MPHYFLTSLTLIAGITTQNGTENPRSLARIESAEHSPI